MTEPRPAPVARLRLGCCVELSDALVSHYLTPLTRAAAVGSIRVVRSRPLDPEPPGVSVDRVARSPRWLRFLRMYRRCRRLVRTSSVDGFVSFNPNPYGLIAALAAGSRMPYHLGFIGSDWYAQTSRSALGRATRPLVRRAAFVTATGPGMREELVEWGVAPDRVRVLPHGVDLDRFVPGDPASASFDFIYVGQLIPRKRVAEILRALALVARQHPGARLAVVGDGPERGRLEALTERLGLRGRVHFTGRQRDVRPWLADARIAVMASAIEGFPFALAEAMACGLVPVSTSAGSIGEILEPEVSGLLVETGDRGGLAAAMSRLLDEPRLYRALRERILADRAELGYPRATAVWEDALAGWPRLSGAAEAQP